MNLTLQTSLPSFSPVEANLTEACPLCYTVAEIFSDKGFFFCKECSGIFRDKKFFLSPAEEKSRYEKHNNDVNDKDYLQFVSPITDSVLSEYAPAHTGLDFGAGTGSAVSKVLKDNKYKIELYDPFFHNRPELLEKKYDYIACCEVMEHFHAPAKEFRLLKDILKTNGTLYCMTHLFSPEILFDDWYYKNDPTHVFFFQKETLEWIKINFGFSALHIDKRLIKLKR